MSETPERLSASRRASVAAQIFSAVECCFAHWEALPGFDWRRAFDTYLDEAMATEDRLAFNLATMRLMAGLRNGHTAFDDIRLWEACGAPIGLDVRPVGPDWTVIASAHQGVPVGSIIRGIDGRPIEAVFEEAEPFLAASTDTARRRRLFARPFLFPPHFRVSLSDGAEIPLSRGTALPKAAMSPTLRRLATGETWLLRLPSFADPAHAAEASRLVRRLPRNARLIVDVRDNGGGDTPEALVAALMPQAYRYWRAATPLRDALGIAKGQPPGMRRRDAEWIEPSSDAFGGPLIILQDGGTLSAAEDFIAPFKDNGRARLFGEMTGGSSGQPLFLDLGDGMRLWVGAKRQWLPDGTPFEGIGIAPDVFAAPAVRDIAEGREPVLALAVAQFDL